MKPKFFLASKTFWFGLATAVAGVAEQMGSIPGLPKGVLTAVGIINIVLRGVTSQPVTMNPSGS